MFDNVWWTRGYQICCGEVGSNVDSETNFLLQPLRQNIETENIKTAVRQTRTSLKYCRK